MARSPVTGCYPRTRSTMQDRSSLMPPKAPTNQKRAVLLTPLQRLVTHRARKPHGAAGEFDIDLPCGGYPAVECRAAVGGGHTIVFTFANEVTGGNAAITEGTATISGSSSYSGKTMTLHLSDVADRQTITVTLSGVTDSFGQTMAPATVPDEPLVR